MKYPILIFCLVFISQNVFSQYKLTNQQKYQINEWKDAYGGKIYYAYNYPKTYKVYKELKRYSGMEYPIIFNQTFNWGQAHNGGLIILDYSTINKNRNILAFVFAHEWGHQALGHQSNVYNPYGSTWKIRSSQTETEDEADVYSGKFLAKYNYDIDIVYNYLANLPINDNDHTHSSGKKRANLVLSGYRSVKSYINKPKYKNITTRCYHIAHPNGHAYQCNHIAHSNGHRNQCQHRCRNNYGYIIPCHPNGHIYQCNHIAHSNGHRNQCNHIIHANGHTKKVRIY